MNPASLFPFLPFLSLMGLLLNPAVSPAADSAAGLSEVASFENRQVTGVAVSRKSGRIFVNFPDWSADHDLSVAEVNPEGKTQPYPDPKWNNKAGAADERFVCVQSLVVDHRDHLWILDTGNPRQQGVIPGGAKMVQVDLATNQILKVIPMKDSIAPRKSYLNDLRIDPGADYAYLTESGVGSLIVVDLAKNTQRRVLANHPSTKVEVGKELEVEGIRPIDPDTAGTPQFHADGIALDAKNGCFTTML